MCSISMFLVYSWGCTQIAFLQFVAEPQTDTTNLGGWFAWPLLSAPHKNTAEQQGLESRGLNGLEL